MRAAEEAPPAPAAPPSRSTMDGAAVGGAGSSLRLRLLCFPMRSTDGRAEHHALVYRPGKQSKGSHDAMYASSAPRAAGSGQRAARTDSLCRMADLGLGARRVVAAGAAACAIAGALGIIVALVADPAQRLDGYVSEAGTATAELPTAYRWGVLGVAAALALLAVAAAPLARLVAPLLTVAAGG